MKCYYYLHTYKISIPSKNMLVFHFLEVGSICMFSHTRANVLNIYFLYRFRNAFSISSDDSKSLIYTATFH